jgi:2,3-dihydroxybenzoate decarboxylase
MDAGRVAMAVLSLGSNSIQDVLDARRAVALARRANDALAQTVATHPNRFAGLAALPMQDPAAASEELHRAVVTLGFRGALVNGYTSNGSLDVARYYDHRDYEPLWSALEELEVPLYLHPRNPLPGQRVIYEGREELLGPTWAFAIETGTHALRLITSGLFDRYPRLQIVLGHLGEFLPFAIHRFEQRLSRIPSVRLERGPSEVLRENFHVTTSGNYHTPSLRACIEQLGAERLLFAADYPFEVLDEGTSWFDALELDDDVKTLIGSRNAARLFALDVPFRSAGDSAR